MTFRSTLTPAAVALGLAFGLGACDAADNFTGDVDGFIDRVDTDSLNQQRAVSFLAIGVEEAFNDAYDASAVLADLLSDAFIFDQDVNGATFPTFDEIDDGDILTSNNSVDGVYNAINQMRYLADDLLRRAETAIEFSADEDGAEAQRLASYTGNFYGGVSRYFLASYFALDPNSNAGAPISESPENLSPLIPSAQLYQQSIDRYTAAKAFVANDYQTRLINTLIARNHLYMGNLAQAESFAAQGLVAGDAPFTGDYNASSQNNWYTQGGIGRTQVVAADRFQTYQDEGDTRVAVEDAPPVAGATRFFVRQAVITDPGQSLPFATWQETALIRAEAAGAGSSAALGFINAVRADAGLDPLASADQDALITERDRTLFLQGQRLLDMRRFGLPFVNADGPVTGPWRYLPIPQNERNANPNF
ncbi:RagB/SusD family nutrient uptake outer membrane protein [Rubrivirga sp. IMCC43871]|uniref:RagB/SusD family nutrient uptake outer membrane protein n=1 Tax=Rubrivirga sp. IMCC43871 TaxID=3391575 RepID=UPI00398F9110